MQNTLDQESLEEIRIYAAITKEFERRNELALVIGARTGSGLSGDPSMQRR